MSTDQQPDHVRSAQPPAQITPSAFVRVPGPTTFIVCSRKSRLARRCDGLTAKSPDVESLELVGAYGSADGTSVFDVEVSADRADGFRVKVRSPAGEADESVQVDVGGLFRQRDWVQRELLASAAADRRILSSDEPVLREMGRQLFISLLGT